MMIGMGLLLGNLFEGVSDAEMYRSELHLAIKAEELGFDAVWSVEHHFDSYAMCPSNIQLMTYLAGRTRNIRLGLGAVILPWHDLLRVIEDVAMLDIVSDGRTLLGFGRGLARMEYAGFRQEMSESRERFDEAAQFVVQSLESGIAEYDGKYYRQPRVEIRPKPPFSFKDRLFGVAMSPDSVVPVAAFGGTMMAFNQGSIEKMMPSILAHREHYQKKFGCVPNPVRITDFTYCHHDAAEAERTARRHLAPYFMSVMRHYDLMGAGFAGVQGYSSYADAARKMQEAGLEKVLEDYIQAQNWGTPEKIVETFRQRFEAAGGFQPSHVFSFGAMPYDQVEASMRLFAKEVIPEMRRIAKTVAVAA
jgi:alkanesulfonate monooxygenase SsuD/methylene tetrahydromethanopterin reductase-like flavin-dependent oxidoreductase (luciferase family)